VQKFANLYKSNKSQIGQTKPPVNENNKTSPYCKIIANTCIYMFALSKSKRDNLLENLGHLLLLQWTCLEGLPPLKTR